SAMQWALVDEDARLLPRSSYAASKVAQEHYAQAWSRQLPGSVVALRYHNVYGPGMPRDTPYSGVAAMFRSAIEGGTAPRVFEDGEQMRDFVHVDDVAHANGLAVEHIVGVEPDTFTAYNICSGHPVRILDVASLIAAGSDCDDVTPEVTGEFRSGDVRHIVASPARASDQLGFTATVLPADGLRAFARVPLRER
ncbi:MAG: NAD-dependent epimerase/dehydratase family protein, partial [Nocardioidaceae bacterium]